MCDARVEGNNLVEAIKRDLNSQSDLSGEKKEYRLHEIDVPQVFFVFENHMPRSTEMSSYTHTCIHKYVRTCKMHKYMYTCNMDKYLYTCIHAYVLHACMHTYIHTYVQTYTNIGISGKNRRA